MNIKQRTISEVVKISGIGLHSGRDAVMEIHPAGVDFGVQFLRMDVSPTEGIRGSYCNVENTVLSTSVVNNGIEVKTIEHFFSALFGLGIDNVLVKIYGSELPILDGSADEFYRKMEKAGIKEQSKDRVYIEILKEVFVNDKGKEAYLLPHNGTRFEFTIDYGNAYIDKTPSEAVYDFERDSYKDVVSVARTFGFEREINYLKEQNLIRGGNLANAIVVGEDYILNEGGLRLENEFAMHKILDAIGDMYLINHQFIGVYKGNKSGHRLNNKLARELMSDKNNFKYTTKKA